eukprot:10414335-Heterocapsa_arctica.AAC.1
MLYVAAFQLVASVMLNKDGPMPLIPVVFIRLAVINVITCVNVLFDMDIVCLAVFSNVLQGFNAR